MSELTDDQIAKLWFKARTGLPDWDADWGPAECVRSTWIEAAQRFVSGLREIGYEIVPASSVRVDPALVEAVEILDWVIEVASWENADAHDALLRLRSAISLIAVGVEPGGRG